MEKDRGNRVPTLYVQGTGWDRYDLAIVVCSFFVSREGLIQPELPQSQVTLRESEGLTLMQGSARSAASCGGWGCRRRCRRSKGAREGPVLAPVSWEGCCVFLRPAEGAEG